MIHFSVKEFWNPRVPLNVNDPQLKQATRCHFETTHVGVIVFICGFDKLWFCLTVWHRFARKGRTEISVLLVSGCQLPWPESEQISDVNAAKNVRFFCSEDAIASVIFFKMLLPKSFIIVYWWRSYLHQSVDASCSKFSWFSTVWFVLSILSFQNMLKRCCNVSLNNITEYSWVVE